MNMRKTSKKNNEEDQDWKYFMVVKWTVISLVWGRYSAIFASKMSFSVIFLFLFLLSGASMVFFCTETQIQLSYASISRKRGAEKIKLNLLLLSVLSGYKQNTGLVFFLRKKNLVCYFFFLCFMFCLIVIVTNCWQSHNQIDLFSFSQDKNDHNKDFTS